MHTLYFTRHGETVWNVENKICGMTDSPLTERGRQQARKLGEAVKASGVHIDEILYSPLSRAADNQRQHKKSPILSDRASARTMAHSQIWRKKPSVSPVMPPNCFCDIR